MQAPTEWGIDCDVLLYSVGFMSQAKDDRGLTAPLISEKQACLQLRNAIERVAHGAGCFRSHIYLTGSHNYREGVAINGHPYKGHRTQDKPIYYHALKEYAISDLGAVVCDGCEADDLLAQGAHFHGHGIATIDKDLNMVPGWHYNWMKNRRYMVSPEAGLQFFYRQLLTGDSADNIPGLYRLCGKKAMAKVLDPISDMDDEVDMWDYVLSVYEEHWPKDANLSAREALRKTGTQLWMDVDGSRGWHPPRE